MSKKATTPSVHTTPNRNGNGWTNVVDGRITSTHRTQETAARAGRDLARDMGTEHRIHRPDGRIRESNSYGNDPNPPKDQR